IRKAGSLFITSCLYSLFLSRKTKEWAIRKKGKKLQLSRTAKPRKDHTDVDIFDAVTKGNLSELEKTLKDNDINKLNPSSETLLHVAAANGHATVMEYLISKGKTPLHLAAQNNHSHIVKILVEEEARSYKNQHNFLHMAALKDESSLAKMLLKAGASIDGKDEKGQPPLSHAVSHGSENTAKVLLEAGASVDSNITETFVTPLHIASQKGSTDAAQQLLYHKAHVNVKDKQLKSPLHFAAERGDRTVVEILDSPAAQYDCNYARAGRIKLAIKGGHGETSVL
uniref:Uncharacterized protein n=1 Tax=Melopsittacus undulatus TaxID=13146 RepID=A0A8V5G828_MELUD